jgi:MoxR-like ATPase
MNYGYAGTRELNEALASRFMVINMPVIAQDNLVKLLKSQFNNLKDEYAQQLAGLFEDIRRKCDSSEISTKALDLRGLMAAVSLVANGLNMGQALEMGITNKSFDDFERQLVSDIIAAKISSKLTAADIFER